MSPLQVMFDKMITVNTLLYFETERSASTLIVIEKLFHFSLSQSVDAFIIYCFFYFTVIHVQTTKQCRMLTRIQRTAVRQKTKILQNLSQKRNSWQTAINARVNSSLWKDNQMFTTKWHQDTTTRTLYWLQGSVYPSRCCSCRICDQS